TLDARPAPERIAAARGLAEAAGFDFEGWNWEFYRPVVARALERGLPLIAANLSRAEALARMRGGAGRGDDPRPAAWPASAEQAMARAIRDGHCGLLPERAVGPMVDAQIARDRTMAGALVSAHRRTGLSVVLLAGNEHVRTDIGVPLHLAARDPGAPLGVVRIDETRHAQSAPGEAKAQTSSIGAIREEGAPAGGFARHIDIAPVQRPDPCEALRTRAIGR